MNNSEYQHMIANFRDNAHKMMFSNSTIDAFGSEATVRQIHAVMRMLDMELASRAETKRKRLLDIPRGFEHLVRKI